MRSLETIAVLIIFFIILVFGISFFFNFQKESFKQASREFNEKRAVSLASSLITLPELSCSELGSTQLCIDELKLKASAEIINKNRKDYSDLLGNSKISIKKLFPDEKSFDLYDFSQITNPQKSIIRIPITLFDPIANKRSYAYLEVTTYN